MGDRQQHVSRCSASCTAMADHRINMAALDVDTLGELQAVRRTKSHAVFAFVVDVSACHPMDLYA